MQRLTESRGLGLEMMKHCWMDTVRHHRVTLQPRPIDDFRPMLGTVYPLLAICKLPLKTCAAHESPLGQAEEDMCRGANHAAARRRKLIEEASGDSLSDRDLAYRAASQTVSAMI
jgi:hypothetical protein